MASIEAGLMHINERRGWVASTPSRFARSRCGVSYCCRSPGRGPCDCPAPPRGSPRCCEGPAAAPLIAPRRYGGAPWLLRRARCAGRLRLLDCTRCTWLLTPRLGRHAGAPWLLRRARHGRARLLRLAGGSRRMLSKPALLVGAQRRRRRNVLRGLNGCLPLLDRNLHALPLRRA